MNDITMVSGDSLDLRVKVYNSERRAVNLAAHTATLYIGYDTVLEIAGVCAGNMAQFSIDSAVMLTAGVYNYEVVIEATNEQYTVAQGTITVIGQSTWRS